MDILQFSGAWNDTFFAISGPWNSLTPFLKFQGPEIAVFWQFQAPKNHRGLITNLFGVFRPLKTERRCVFRCWQRVNSLFLRKNQYEQILYNLNYKIEQKYFVKFSLFLEKLVWFKAPRDLNFLTRLNFPKFLEKFKQPWVEFERGISRFHVHALAEQNSKMVKTQIQQKFN